MLVVVFRPSVSKGELVSYWYVARIYRYSICNFSISVDLSIPHKMISS
jgi:hypothetical protein